MISTLHFRLIIAFSELLGQHDFERGKEVLTLRSLGNVVDG
jgi:hypothetical protein